MKRTLLALVVLSPALSAVAQPTTVIVDSGELLTESDLLGVRPARGQSGCSQITAVASQPSTSHPGVVIASPLHSRLLSDGRRLLLNASFFVPSAGAVSPSNVLAISGPTQLRLLATPCSYYNFWPVEPSFTDLQPLSTNARLVTNRTDQSLFAVSYLIGDHPDDCFSEQAYGLFRVDPDAGAQLVADSLDHWPGLALDDRFVDFENYALNDANEVVFVSSTHLTTRGIWTSVGTGGFQPVALLDQQAPGVGVGATFSFVGEPVLDDQGSVTFIARYQVPEGGEGWGIWRKESGDEVRLVINNGAVISHLDPDGVELCPGQDGSGEEAETVVLGIGDTAWAANHAGDFVFAGRRKCTNSFVIEPGAVVFGIDASESVTTLIEANQENEGMPVILEGYTRLALANSGELAFVAIVGSEFVLGRRRATDSISILAQSGEQAPGCPEGVVFGPLGGNVVINDQGDVAWTANLSGPGVGASNDVGLWYQQGGANEATLVVRTGDLVPIGFGSLSVVTRIYLDDGRTSVTSSRSSLDEMGRLAYSVELSFGGGAELLFQADSQMCDPMCAVDLNGDFMIDIDDLYYITQHPTDINGDGNADAADAACLERYLRRNELEDMTAGRR